MIEYLIDIYQKKSEVLHFLYKVNDYAYVQGRSQ